MVVWYGFRGHSKAVKVGDVAGAEFVRVGGAAESQNVKHQFLLNDFITAPPLTFHIHSSLATRHGSTGGPDNQAGSSSVVCLHDSKSYTVANIRVASYWILLPITIVMVAPRSSWRKLPIKARN